MDLSIPFSIYLILGVILSSYFLLKDYLIRRKVWALIVLIMVIITIVSYSGFSYESKFNAHNLMNSTDIINNNITVKWATNLEYLEGGWENEIESDLLSLIPEDGKLYVSYICQAASVGARFGVCCLSADNGSLIWESIFDPSSDYDILYGLPGNMVLLDNRLYVTSEGNWLFCLDKSTGAIFWETEFEGGSSTNFKVIRHTNDSIYCGGSNLYEINCETGEVIYKNPNFYGLYGANGDLVLTSNYSRLEKQISCLNITTNNTEWGVTFSDWINVAINEKNDKAIVISQNRHIYCYDVISGFELWNKSISIATSVTKPLICGDRVYFNSGNLFCLNVSNGDEIFNISCPTKGATPVMYSNSELLLQEDGVVYLFSLENFRVVWKYRHGSSYFKPNQVSAFPMFYVPDGNTILAFDDSEYQEMSFSVFPQDVTWNLLDGDAGDDTLLINFRLKLQNSNGFISPSESYYYIVSMSVDQGEFIHNLRVPLSRDGMNMIEKAKNIYFYQHFTDRNVKLFVQLYCDDELLQEKQWIFSIEMNHPGGNEGLIPFADEVCGSLAYILLLMVPFLIIIDFLKANNRYNQLKPIKPPIQIEPISNGSLEKNESTRDEDVTIDKQTKIF